MAEPRTRRQQAVFGLKVVLFAAAVVLAGRAISFQWSKVRDNVSHLSIGWTSLSVSFAIAGLIAIAMIWREVLADLGSTLSVTTSARVFLLAQLGKYIPGSVFVLAGQMELATRYDVPRRRAGTASLVTLGLNTAAALLVGLCALPILPYDSAKPFLPAPVILP